MAMESFSGCQTSEDEKKLSWFSSFVNKILWLKTTQDQHTQDDKSTIKENKGWKYKLQTAVLWKINEKSMGYI